MIVKLLSKTSQKAPHSYHSFELLLNKTNRVSYKVLTRFLRLAAENAPTKTNLLLLLHQTVQVHDVMYADNYVVTDIVKATLTPRESLSEPRS